MNTKHQQLSTCGNGLCLTIPDKAVQMLDINTKRFLEWETKRGDIIGTLVTSETVVTTRVQQAKNGRYSAEVLHAYVVKYKLHPTKKGGPKATCEWDESAFTIRIAAK
jgi:hypothetical protein